jgi:hypothetical protein
MAIERVERLIHKQNGQIGERNTYPRSRDPRRSKGWLRELLRPPSPWPVGELAEREANVAFANDLLDTEIAQRNARKDAQENTARGVIVAAGLVLTLLLGLAKDAGLFASSTSVVARVALAATMLAGGGGAACAMGTLWPRKYDRLGSGGLGRFNDPAFLDQATHEVTGTVVATRIGIAETMDTLHERKARWLKWSFRLLLVAFVGLIVQGGVLAIDPPTPAKPAAAARILNHQTRAP